MRQTISANSEPDLFWGMRGAGGSLGVAIEYSTYAFAVPDNVRISAPQPCCALQALDWQCTGRSPTLASAPLSDNLSACKAPVSLCGRQGACTVQTLLRWTLC